MSSLMSGQCVPEILAQQSLPLQSASRHQAGPCKASEAQLQAASSGRPAGSWSYSSAQPWPALPPRPAWGQHHALGTCHAVAPAASPSTSYGCACMLCAYMCVPCTCVNAHMSVLCAYECRVCV